MQVSNEKMLKRAEKISALDELCVYADNNKEYLSVYSTFSAKDRECLENDSADNPKYKLSLQKYNHYLYEVVEDFERGPYGLKSNVDKDGLLKVLNEEDSSRMLFLARDYTRNELQKAQYDEFQILYDRYDDTLRKMAMKAQERGLVCWIPQSMKQNQSKRRVFDRPGLRQRTPVNRNL